MEQGYAARPRVPARCCPGRRRCSRSSAVDEGVKLVAEAGIDAIRAKGIALTEFAIALADELLAPVSACRVASPRDPTRRGAHVALAHPEAQAPVRRS